MVWLSSTFDILTFGPLYLFQILGMDIGATGDEQLIFIPSSYYCVSISWTQTLVLYTLRTKDSFSTSFLPIFFSDRVVL